MLGRRLPYIPPTNSISPEEIVNLHGANEYSPRRREMKVRKNEMKLRENEIGVPKNLFVPPWIIDDLYGGVSDFLREIKKKRVI